MLPYIIPRLRDVLFLAVFTAVIMLGPRMLNQDGDLPRHLAMGKIILQSGNIPTQDIFSFTNNGKPFAPHEWLAGVIFYIIYKYTGMNGIVLFAAVLISTCFSIIYTYAVSDYKIRLPIFVLIVWGAAISSLHWITRPHLFSMLFLAIWLVLTKKLAQGKLTHLWILPLLMLVWANLHGEFIAGFLVLLAFLAGWFWEYLFEPSDQKLQTGKQLGSTILLSFITSFLNPVGVRTWTTVLGYVNNNYLITHTNETIPPDFTQPKFLVLLVFLSFSIIILSLTHKPILPSYAFLLAGFTALCLLSARNVHLYGVVSPFVLSSCLLDTIKIPRIKHFEDLFSSVENRLRGYLWLIATVVIFSIFLLFTPIGRINRFDPAFFPVEAVAWLKQNPQAGEMFNAFDWGGYLIFNLWPDKRVFIDSQTDVYGEDFTRKYEQIILLRPGWLQILDEYNVTWVLIPSSWPLARELVQQPEWQTVYQDDTAIILKK